MTVDIRKARQRLLDRRARKSEELDRRFQLSWNDFESIVEMLIREYSPERIYQWGSLLKRRHFSDLSDIDIAVEGITSAQTFFAMYGDAEELTRFPLDLIQIEKIDPVYAKAIRDKGRIVYERED